MADRLKIPADARVLVADGRKALFLLNAGNAQFPNLRVDKVLEATENPPTHLQGTDEPGRVAMGTHRSSVEQTDWHKQAEARFAEAVAEQLSREPETDTIIVAAPRFLAQLRHVMPKGVEAKILAEIPKDLTNIPVGDIEKNLLASRD